MSILERLGFEILAVRVCRASIYPRFYEVVKIAKLIIRRGEN